MPWPLVVGHRLAACPTGRARPELAAGLGGRYYRDMHLIYVFGDQWRAQALGYAGDANVRTPHLDALAQRSLRFDTAVANCPVCTPSRACLLTGQYPLTHGLFLNDARLDPTLPSIGKSLKAAGYATGYVGKWHLDGPDRSGFVPPERRHGFDFWRGWNCTHSYNASHYHADNPTERRWQGYDAIEQTKVACDFIRGGAGGERPVALFLSWGPPHNPYETAPPRYRDLYDPDQLALRPNVPADAEAQARKDLAGYYAHCTALDDCMGQIIQTLEETGILDEMLLVFSSDHGDMLGSQGQDRKQKPWDESILVPMLAHAPRLLGRPRVTRAPFAIVDTMPTLLDLLGVEIPEGVEGISHASHWRGESGPVADAALIACYHPFCEWEPAAGGREYRGVRTRRYTYVRTLAGPWLLYDNETDPYQLSNLVDTPALRDVQQQLDARLDGLLAACDDDFRSGREYVQQWGYTIDQQNQIPHYNYK
jgi:arylsulfatase A-like enzyme